MNKKGKKRILIALLSLLIVWAVAVTLRYFFSRYDYQQVLDGEKPTFSIKYNTFKDGGTVLYQGLGYSLTSLNRFSDDKEHPKRFGVYRGPILEYQLNWLLLPLADERNVRFEEQSNLSFYIGLVNNLDKRRQWKTVDVKIAVTNPTVELAVTPRQSEKVRVRAWSHSDNDFNTAMMRLDDGDLYAITEDEFNELSRRAGNEIAGE